MKHFVLVCCVALSAAAAGVDRPRGVPLDKAPFYDPSKPFKCLDGSDTIPFSLVNDDYCDCEDGSDEPGTSACSNAVFYCSNVGHAPMNLLSSRVNDQICDCCDGSDEYSGHVSCPDICLELGQKAREDADRKAAIQREGHKMRQQMIADGKRAKEESTKKLTELEEEKKKLDPERDDLDMKKKDAEKLETEAKNKHDAAHRAVKEEMNAEELKTHAEAAFKELDADGDGKISNAEIQAIVEFDKDNDGEVSEEEAKEWLADEEPNLDQFTSATFESIQEPFKKFQTNKKDKEKQERKERRDKEKKEAAEDGEGQDEDEDLDEDDPENEIRDEDLPEPADTEAPPYDEDTLKLIDAADQAREAYDKVDRRIRDIDDEIRRIKEGNDLDTGKEGEFAYMKGQCFEVTEHEYIYKLCPFEKATQRSKSGGSETNLGRWGQWSGPPENPYARMKYTGGQNCWNGPDRSVEVTLECGTETAIHDGSEPGRCEYALLMSTPALCTTPGTQGHDELR